LIDEIRPGLEATQASFDAVGLRVQKCTRSVTLPIEPIKPGLPVGGKVWDNSAWRSSSVFPHCFFRELRQARKGAAAAKRAGAGVGLARAASFFYPRRVDSAICFRRSRPAAIDPATIALQYDFRRIVFYVTSVTFPTFFVIEV